MDMTVHVPPASTRRWRGAFYGNRNSAAFWQIGVEKAEHVGALDCSYAFLFLDVGDAFLKRFHFRPVNFGPEMMFGVVAVVEEEPIIKLVVAAHAPRDRFVRISAIMPVITVQVAKAVAEIPKRQEINDE